MARATDSRAAGVWKERLDRFERYYRTVAAFCRSEGVSAAAYYYWKRRLRQIPETAEAGSSAAFAEIQVVHLDHVRDQLPNGTMIHLPTGDPRIVENVIRTLAETATVAPDASLGGAAC